MLMLEDDHKRRNNTDCNPESQKVNGKSLFAPFIDVIVLALPLILKYVAVTSGTPEDPKHFKSRIPAFQANPDPNLTY